MQIIHALPNLAKGGAEKMTIDLANKQISQGHRVCLIFANSQHSQTNFSSLDKNIEIIHIDSADKNKILTYTRCAAWIVRNKSFLRTFDVVHTHLTFGLIFGTLSRILVFPKKSQKTRLIFTCHLVGMNVNRLLSFFTNFNSFFYDNFVLMAKDRYWNRMLKENEKYVFIENGIEPLVCTSYKEGPIIRIGSLGRLVKDRKPEMIIDLFSKINQSIIGAEFVVGGDGPLRLMLQNSLGQLNNPLFVEFQGLIESPVDFYSSLDFYITLNVGGTTGISGLEAVSLGIPTLAIQLDPWYKNGEQDWIPSFSSNSLFVEYLQKLIESKDALRALLNRQQVIFEANFTVESMASKYEAIYSK